MFVTTTNTAALLGAGAGAGATQDDAEGKKPRQAAAAATTAVVEEISALCKRNRIPVNVVDSPSLCTFSLLSTHTDGPLQIGITTNGRGCHLAGRIRREVAAALPPDLGAGCARLGEVRRRVREEDRLRAGGLGANGEQEVGAEGEGEVEGGTGDRDASFNRLVAEEDLDAAKNRRVRWLAQVCEYWPLKRLAALTDEDVEAVLKSYPGGSISTSLVGCDDPTTDNNIINDTPPKLGRLILAGSGPGHPDLLTRATHKAILAADLVLADKLVPSGVLDLIPRRTPVSIARKYPGNAEQAQAELYALALEGVRAGKTVLRLKQGDPFVYGRGGEEVAYFRALGLGETVTTVLPGVTSALSAPLFAGVPCTQRDVADQILVCTGTGKKGKPPAPPEYVAGRTCVFLMALHRIGALVGELTRYTAQELGKEKEEEERGPKTPPTNGTVNGAVEPRGQDVSYAEATATVGKAEGRTGLVTDTDTKAAPTRALWPPDTPCAVVERASCPDQRVIRTTLRFVARAVEHEGSRPPGLLVVGRACEALYTPDPEQAAGGANPWAVEEGFRGLEGIGGVEMGWADGDSSVGVTGGTRVGEVEPHSLSAS